MLEPLVPAHARALFAALEAPELYRFVPGEPPRDASHLEVRYRRTSAGPAAPAERWWNWAVAERAEPAAFFGTVELSLRENGACAQLAYMLAPAAQGRGFATEACAAALTYVRERAGTRAVEAYVDTRNARSQRLLERLGFARVETIANADYFKGSASDEYHYRLSLET